MRLPEEYSAFAYASGPVRVPERAPTLVLRGAVAFPHSLTLVHVVSPASAWVLREVGNERFPSVCLAATLRPDPTHEDLGEVRPPEVSVADLEELLQGAELRLDAGQHAEAVALCKRALRALPTAREPWELLGRVYRAQGEGAKALEAIAKAKRAKPARRLAREGPEPEVLPPPVDDLSRVGCIARVLGVSQERSGSFGALIEVGERVRILEFAPRGPLLIATVEPHPESEVPVLEPTLAAKLHDAAEARLRVDLQNATLAHDFLATVTSPVTLAGICVWGLELSALGQQELLEADGRERVTRVLQHLRLAGA